MNKKILIIALVLLILGLAGGVYYWKYKKPAEIQVAPETQAVNELQDITESVTEGVVEGSAVPSLGDTTTGANPLENVQDTNPYNKTNPFSNKINPFE